MTSQPAPPPINWVRRGGVAVAVAAAIAAPAGQAIMDWGLSPPEFAAAGNATLRAAGYAFSIWGLIYGALALCALRLMLPSTHETAAVSRFGWPLAFAAAACADWIVVTALGLRWLSVLVIVAGLVAAVWPFVRGPMPMSRVDRLLVAWPTALLAGWLTVAAPLNLVTVLTAEALIPAGSQLWAILTLALAAGGAVVVSLRSASAIYLIPVIWGLVAVYVAERGDQPATAYAAVGGAVLLALIAVWIAQAKRR